MKQLALARPALALAACGEAAVQNDQANAPRPPRTPAPTPQRRRSTRRRFVRRGPPHRDGDRHLHRLGDGRLSLGQFHRAGPRADRRPARDGAIGLFLDAHRGRQVTAEIATVRTDIPEAGGPTEIQRVTAARNAAGDAASWWNGDAMVMGTPHVNPLTESLRRATAASPAGSPTRPSPVSLPIEPPQRTWSAETDFTRTSPIADSSSRASSSPAT